MANIDKFKQEYQEYKSTFKTTSFDSDNGIYLCYDETQEVIDFDSIVETKFPDSNIRPKSFDAIYIYNKLIFCIEFKNQKPSDINNSEVQGKLVDGKDELIKIFQKLNIQKDDYSFVYCVVYKVCKEPISRYKCGIDKNKILFGLDNYKKSGFVKEIYTQNVNFFTKEFKKHFRKELMC
jgi:hypothetical protein